MLRFYPKRTSRSSSNSIGLSDNYSGHAKISHTPYNDQVCWGLCFGEINMFWREFKRLVTSGKNGDSKVVEIAAKKKGRNLLKTNSCEWVSRRSKYNWMGKEHWKMSKGEGTSSLGGCVGRSKKKIKGRKKNWEGFFFCVMVVIFDIFLPMW